MSRRNFELDSNSGRPALVWYLQNTVKRPPEESWECLLDHSCGGFSCNTLDGWVQRINLAEPTMSLISRIADEEFAAGCKGESLDYGVGVDHRAAYEAFLQAHGLVSGNPRMLQQAVYPLAATSEVLGVLGADHGVQPEGAILLVLGWNCD